MGSSGSSTSKLVIEISPDHQVDPVYCAKGKFEDGKDAIVEDRSTLKDPELKDVVKVETITLIYTKSDNPGRYVWIPLPGGGSKRVCY